MRITQGEILSIWNEILSLTKDNKKWPLKLSHALFMTKQAIKDQIEFRMAEEKRIFEENGVSFKEDGTLIIEDHTKEADFQKQLNDLNALVVEIESNPIDIPINIDLDISEQSLEILYPFIHFV